MSYVCLWVLERTSVARNSEVCTVSSHQLTDIELELGPVELPASKDKTSVATIAPPVGRAASATASEQGKSAEAPACEKCHTPLTGKQGWCRRCGWYPRIGTFVEL